MENHIHLHEVIYNNWGFLESVSRGQGGALTYNAWVFLKNVYGSNGGVLFCDGRGGGFYCR